LPESKPKTPASTDPERFFRTDHLKADLRGRSIRGGAITILAQVSKLIMQFGSIVVLARLLEPEDYGLIGMVTVITGFISIFKDLGLSMATMQREQITQTQVSTLFWINVGISSAIMLLTVALAPVIAWFYGEPRLILITLVLGSGFIFGGLTVQHQALLKRQMRLGALAVIDIISMISSISIALTLAILGTGYWALVAMQLAMAIINCIGVWVSCGWRPGWPKFDSDVAPMLAFGGWNTGFTVVNYFTRNLDNLLIGKFWGADQLGLYAQAYKLLVLPLQQINFPLSTVALPGLCSVQSDPERYRSYYGKAVEVMVMLGMPISVYMAVDADNLIINLLGTQWSEAIILFRSLAPVAFISTFNVATAWVFISMGRADRQFHWNMFASAITVIGFLIGVRWGALGIAIAASITFCGLRYPGIVYCFQSSPLTPGFLMKILWKPAVASFVAGGLLWFVRQAISWSINPFVEIAIHCALYALFYLSCWCILPNGRQTLKQVLQLLKELRQKPKKVG
jgi:O-antigen/teichoic acid export membrane protein